MLTRPCNGRVTSHFKLNRKHPITGKIRPHYGIDFGSHSDNSIYAAADGVVTRAEWISEYGIAIYIDHNINGRKIQTAYAHLSTLNVRKGQRVKKGQVIGIKGTTGNSTGIHLHFEVHDGGRSGWGNAVDPRGYVEGLTLQKGVTGPRVGELQRILRITEDESFGPATEKAVMKFQKEHGLEEDGLVGPATQKKLDEVRPKLKVDGYWGEETTKALQRHFGTIVDGKISKPSMLIKAMQQWLGTPVDGIISEPSMMVRALQKRLGTPVDGIISEPSLMVRELQRRLNAGNL